MSDPVSTPLAVDENVAYQLAPAIGVELDAVVVTRDGDGTTCIDVPPQTWTAAAAFLRDRCGLDFFDWLSAVDQPDADPPGLDVVLHVADSRSGGARGPATGVRRVRRTLLRTRVPDAVGHLASLTAVWPGVAWHERETFEMFGLTFDDYDDGSGLPLRPILLPEGFEGTPLRKSFVLAARASKAWPGAKEPGESDSHAAPSRRKTLPPGVPDPATWPREAGSPLPPPPGPADGPPARGARAPRGDRPVREPRVPREPRTPRTAPGPDSGTTPATDDGGAR